MSDVRIDMATREVEFVLTDGSELKGQVYVSMHSKSGAGIQRIDELLSVGDQFLPFRSSDGFLLLNRSRVMLARVSLEENTGELARMGEKYRVKMTTILGTTITAEIFVNLPKDYQRVKDYLNHPVKYFTCFTEEHVLYVNREFILLVED
ncbi:MAG: hypothetical protein AVO35_12415 [Candidatus Aegiribacteria sp. MLS_C]|nr:MAG: hypothetical protein AVO35_12415 [Candidatus Aegiribacteria sp. MLS_C]